MREHKYFFGDDYESKVKSLKELIRTVSRDIEIDTRLRKVDYFGDHDVRFYFDDVEHNVDRVVECVKDITDGFVVI